MMRSTIVPGLLITLGLILLVCSSSWGQNPSDRAFTESVMAQRFSERLIAPTQSSILEDFFNPFSAKLDLDPATTPTGLLLRRSMSQERVISDGSAFTFGLLSKDATEIGVSPFGRTSMSFSTKSEELRRLNQDLVSSRTVRAFGLQQGFGSESTNGMLSFNRTSVTTQESNNDPRTDTTQVFNLNASLRPGLSTASAFTTKDSSDEAGPSGRDWTTKFDMSLSGGAGTMSMARSDYTQGGRQTLGQMTDVLLPLRFMGNRLTLARHTGDITTAGVLTNRDDSEGLTYPFKLSGGDAILNLQTADRVAPGLTQLVRTTDVVLPFRIAGQTIDLSRHANDETKNGIRVMSDVQTVGLPIKVPGGLARVAYTLTDTWKAGIAQDISQLDIGLPLSLNHRTYILERHDVNAETNGVGLNSLTTKLSGPLPILGGAGTADYTILNQTQADVTTDTNTLHLTTPLNLIGRAISADLVDATQTTVGSRQSQRIIGIVAPMFGQSLNIQHHITTTQSGAMDTTRAVTQVVSPRLNLLSGRFGINARLMRTETDDAPTQQVTGMDFSANPIRPLTLQGTIETRNTGPATEGATRTLTGTYALSNQVSLNARLLQNEVANQSTTLDRRWMLTANPTKGMAMTAGVVSWAQNGVPDDSANQASLRVGDPKGVNLAAEYKGVDFDKNGAIVAMPDPSMNLALAAGDPKHVAIQLRHVSTPGQPAIERGLGLQFQALGGNMRLGYGDNTADPHNPKAIRLAKLYDIGIERQIFGNVNLNLGLRYCGVEDQRSDLFRSIQVSGGNPDGGGEIRLTAMSGDFVPVTQAGQVPLDSTLDLSFNKNLGGGGRFSLTVKRTVGSPACGIEPNSQAMLEYRRAF